MIIHVLHLPRIPANSRVKDYVVSADSRIPPGIPYKQLRLLVDAHMICALAPQPVESAGLQNIATHGDAMHKSLAELASTYRSM